jgi:HAE1 family hydrophobic/amphiphilic exporter-1
MLKPWDQRSKAKGTDILSIAEAFADCAERGAGRQAICRAAAADQGIGNAGSLQCKLELLGGSFDYQKLNIFTQQLVKGRGRSPTAARP